MEYLESTGTQWIDTGVSAPNGFRAELDFELTKAGTAVIIGAEDSFSPYNRNYFKIVGSSMEIGALEYKTFGSISPNVRYNVDVDTSSDNLHCITNGVEYDLYTPSSSQRTDLSLALLGFNMGGSYDRWLSSAKLYSCKIYNDGVLVRDYVPVFDNNDVACMYDKVTGQFFYNQGTGDFVAGPVTYVVPEPSPAPEPEPTPVSLDSVDLQIGANSGENNTLNVELGFSLNGFAGDVTSIESASDTLNAVDELKKTLNEKRSEIGVSRNRIDGIIESQSIKIENLSASHSTIVDTDFAQESAVLVRSQILQQATSSLLKQANITQQLALQLLQ